jgi:hypothetical protein
MDKIWGKQALTETYPTAAKLIYFVVPFRWLATQEETLETFTDSPHEAGTLSFDLPVRSQEL